MSWRRIISFDVPDEIANNFNQIGIVVGNLHACECIFDQYHQLEAIVTPNYRPSSTTFLSGLKPKLGACLRMVSAM